MFIINFQYKSFVDSQAARKEAVKQLTEKAVSDAQQLTETTIINLRKQFVINFYTFKLKFFLIFYLLI